MNTKFEIGKKVYWTDPDDGHGSGVYEVTDIDDDTLFLTNDKGSEVQVFVWECEVTEV